MTKSRFLFAPFILGAALAACTPEPAELFADAQASFEANDFNAARVALVNGLQGDPDNTDMIVLLARTQIALGNGEGAAARLEQLPADLLEQPRIAALRGEAEVLKRRFDAAIALVDGVETGAADRVRALAQIGLGNLEEAAASFAAGAAREEQDARLLASYARFELAVGNPESAASLVERALKQDPKLVEAYLVRAAIFEQGNALPDAITAYDAALALHAQNFDGRLGKALLLARQGDNDAAREMAASLRREAPEAVGPAVVEARIHANGGDWDKVRSALQPFETELFAEERGSILYSEALIELGVPGLAVNYLRPLHEAQPGHRQVRALYARALLAANDSAAALAIIYPLARRPDATSTELKTAADAAQATGNNAASLFRSRMGNVTPEWVGGELAKADRALRNREWREAERAYRAILERIGNSNALVLNNLAFALEKQGRKDEALQHALAAVELEPQNASILDTAGWLLVETGATERGIAMLERAAVIAPDNRTVARHLSEARAK